MKSAVDEADGEQSLLASNGAEGGRLAVLTLIPPNAHAVKDVAPDERLVLIMWHVRPSRGSLVVFPALGGFPLGLWSDSDHLWSGRL